MTEFLWTVKKKKTHETLLSFQFRLERVSTFPGQTKAKRIFQARNFPNWPASLDMVEENVGFSFVPKTGAGNTIKIVTQGHKICFK